MKKWCAWCSENSLSERPEDLRIYLNLKEEAERLLWQRDYLRDHNTEAKTLWMCNWEQQHTRRQSDSVNTVESLTGDSSELLLLFQTPEEEITIDSVERKVNVFGGWAHPAEETVTSYQNSAHPSAARPLFVSLVLVCVMRSSFSASPSHVMWIQHPRGWSVVREAETALKSDKQ